MRIKHHTSLHHTPGLADKVCKMLDAVLYFFVTLVFTVIILFVFTVISAKNAVKRRNNQEEEISNNQISNEGNQQPEIERETELNNDEVENTPEFVRQSDSLELWEAYDMMPEEYTGARHHQQMLDLRRRCSSVTSSSESSRRSSNAAVQSLFQMFVSDKKLNTEAKKTVELLTRGEEDGDEQRRTSWPLLQLRKRKSRHFSLRNIPE